MLIQQGSKLFESVSNLCFQYRWLLNRASSGMYKTCWHRDAECHPQVFNPISALNECLVLSGCIDLWQLHPICLFWNFGSNVLMHQKTQIWNENCQNCSKKNNLDTFQTNKNHGKIHTKNDVEWCRCGFSSPRSSLGEASTPSTPGAPWASDHVWCRWRRLYRPANLMKWLIHRDPYNGLYYNPLYHIIHINLFLFFFKIPHI